ncbi:MAG: type II toxin-antitoxin system YafO family toxin [Gammaproteobacteria bacterium]|nr:type II toxin-antitoxin system YafO family toxin [Gammaproteobacteria bacterium]
MAIKVFTSQKFRELLTDDEARRLVDEFREYKETGVASKSFGRDAPYHWPSSVVAADLRHLHLYEKASEPYWHLAVVQYRRVSDCHLVYCCGSHPSNYLMITMLREKAHEQAKKVTFMAALAEIAEKFKTKY